MPLLPIDDLGDPRLAEYRHVPDPELLRRGRIFVAEGRLVVRTLLTASRCAVRSLLLTRAALESLRDVAEPRLPDLPVYLVTPEAIEQLTGYNIHRGCLAIGERPPALSLESLLTVRRDAQTLLVLEQIGNADNVGGLFRNAAAFGVDGVVLGPSCCDPLYRKAIRVSMGASLRVPFAAAEQWPQALTALQRAGFSVAALTPHAEAVSLDDFAEAWKKGGRLAVLVGAEGAGLTPDALASADAALRIPMAPGADSLNVATAAAIALHRLVRV